MNISIFASLWAQNLGDELIVKNEVELLKQEFGKDTQFHIYSYDTAHPFFTAPNIIYKEYFPIAFSNPKNVFRNIRNYFGFIGSLLWSDVMVIGWGGIFYDHELNKANKPLRQWLFRVKMARLLKKKIYFYAVSLDITDASNDALIQDIFRSAYKVSVRDELSQDYLSRCAIESELVNDPVIYDNNHKTPSRSCLITSLESSHFQPWDIPLRHIAWKTLWLALRKGYLSQSWSDQIELAMVRELLEYICSHWWTVILLPHSFHPIDPESNDAVFFQDVLQSVSSQYQPHISLCSSMQETYDVYRHKKLDIVIAQRLHSMILSEAYELPYIALSYAAKTRWHIKKISA